MSSDDDHYGPRKIGAMFPVSQELIDQMTRPSIIELLFRPDGRTDEQKMADLAKRDAEVAAERATILHRHAQILAAAGHPLIRAVLELHAPVIPEHGWQAARCEGCDMEGYECEHPEFPCRTYDLIAAAISDSGGTQ